MLVHTILSVFTKLKLVKLLSHVTFLTTKFSRSMVVRAFVIISSLLWCDVDGEKVFSLIKQVCRHDVPAGVCLVCVL